MVFEFLSRGREEPVFAGTVTITGRAKTGTAVERRTLSLCQRCPGSAEDLVTYVPGSCRGDHDRDLPKARMENE